MKTDDTITYMEWQINDMKNTPLSKSVRDAMEHHARKYGRVPNILEFSDRIDVKELPLLEGVRISRTSIPANIILLTVG